MPEPYLVTELTVIDADDDTTAIERVVNALDGSVAAQTALPLRELPTCRGSFVKVVDGHPAAGRHGLVLGIDPAGYVAVHLTGDPPGSIVSIAADLLDPDL